MSCSVWSWSFPVAEGRFGRIAGATGGKVHARGFNSALFHEPDGAPKDFSLNDPMDHASGYPYTRDPRARAVGEVPLLTWLWQEAVKEWP